MIVQSNFFSISRRSWYIRESTDNCGSDRTEAGRLRSLSFLFLDGDFEKQAKANALVGENRKQNGACTLVASVLEGSFWRLTD
jgi:hypothetical protein